MFSGIVEEVGQVVRAEPYRMVIAARKVLEDLKNGDSIAVNGTCLTVVERTGQGFTVDLSPETLQRTNLGVLKIGSGVNLERSLALGERLGGHIVQGHVDGTGKIASFTKQGDFFDVRFTAPRRLARYIVEKGFIAVDGVSLTVVRRTLSSFSVAVIPYTYQNTVLREQGPGDPVNLEVDIVAKYVESLLQGHLGG